MKSGWKRSGQPTELSTTTDADKTDQTSSIQTGHVDTEELHGEAVDDGGAKDHENQTKQDALHSKLWFPTVQDLYFCSVNDVSHLNNPKQIHPTFYNKPNSAVGKWTWLCWWRNRSCGCFRKVHRFRQIIRGIAGHRFFQWFIAVVVIGDCVQMAFGPESVEAFPELGYVLVTIYILEMLCKMIAHGVICHRHSYFMSGWNWLDCALTIASITSLVARQRWDLNLSAFRALRTVRILRTISVIESMKVLVNALIHSLRELLEVLVLSMFWMVIFALMGLQFFMGVMKRRCVLPPSALNHTIISNGSLNSSFNAWTHNPEHWDPPYELQLCGNVSHSRRCSEPFICLELPLIANPYGDSLSFDSFGDALLAVLQLVILDEWDDIYRKVVSACGPWSTLFFVATTFLGSFQLLNVILAVIDTAYHHELANASESKQMDQLNLNNSAKASESPSLVPQMSHRNVQLQSIDATVTADSASMNNEVDEQQCFHGFPRLSRRVTLRLSLNQIFSISAKSTRSSSQISAAANFQSQETSEPMRVFPYHQSASVGEVLIQKTCNWLCVLRTYCREAVCHKIFQSAIAFLISANTVLMSSEYYGMGEIHQQLLERVNIGFTVTFSLELIIKALVMNPRQFIEDRWNIFDGIIVISSVMDLFISQLFPGLTIIRILRLLRIVRLARVWRTLRVLILTMFGSLPAVINMTFVAFIMVITLAMFGMHVLYQYYNDQNLRWTFSDFPHSMMHAFLIMCGSYIGPLRQCIKHAGNEYYICLISLTPLFIVGNLMILNLYVSILLNSFSRETFASDKPSKVATYSKKVAKKITSSISQTVHEAQRRISLPTNRFSPQTHQGNSKSAMDSSMEFEKCTGYHHARPMGSEGHKSEANSMVILESALKKQDLSLTHKQRFTNMMKFVVSSKAFEIIILLFILLSAAALAMEDIHLPKRPVLRKALIHLNILFTIVFSMETVLRILAFGCKHYFTNSWCILDFLIVVIAVTAMGMAIPAVLNVIAMCMIILLMFAILAVNLFAGRMSRCTVNSTNYEIPVNKSWCTEQFGGSAWQPSKYHFNHVGASYLALFGVASLDNWVTVYEQASDVVEIDETPQFEANYLQASVFFIFFTIAGSFFTLNLFIGVIIDNFNNLKQQMEGKSLRVIMMSSSQKDFFRAVQRMTRVKKSQKKHKSSRFKSAILHIVESNTFETFILLCVLANVAVMCTYRYDQSSTVRNVQYWTDLTFTIIFTVELALKAYALEMSYFDSGWNVLDCVVIILGWLGYTLNWVADLLPTSSTTVIRIVRVFRITKTMKLARGMRSLQAVVRTMLLSLPALFNVALLLFLAMFIYAIMGVQLFSHIKPTGVLDSVMNFQTLAGSLMVLFIMMTGSQWTEVLKSLTVEPPLCGQRMTQLFSTELISDCGTYPPAILFCTSYILIMAFILINTYIAIVLENFLEIKQESFLSDDDLDDFYETWTQYDPDATQFIHMKQLSNFLDSLRSPLRVSKPNRIRSAIMDVDLSEGDFIHCTDLMQSLVKFKTGALDANKLPNNLLDILDAHFAIHFPEVKYTMAVSSSRTYRLREWAVTKIAQFWKYHQQRALNIG